MQNAPAKIKYDHQYVIHFKSFIFLLSPGKVIIWNNCEPFYIQFISKYENDKKKKK